MALFNCSPLGRQPDNPNVARTPVYPLREREWGLASSAALHKRLLPYFLVAGHHNNARYLSWHYPEMSVLLPAEAKDDFLSGAFVCRHTAGSWNAVSADQFGEQTAIKIGKGGVKGITLSSTQVAEWIESFTISAYVSDTLDHRQRISTELGRTCFHPIDTDSDVLYNVHNEQVAPTMVNVSYSLAFGGTMATAFRNSLST